MLIILLISVRKFIDHVIKCILFRYFRDECVSHNSCYNAPVDIRYADQFNAFKTMQGRNFIGRGPNCMLATFYFKSWL